MYLIFEERKTPTKIKDKKKKIESKIINVCAI